MEDILTPEFKAKRHFGTVLYGCRGESAEARGVQLRGLEQGGPGHTRQPQEVHVYELYCLSRYLGICRFLQLMY